MRLPEDELKRLCEIWEQEFGERISIEQAGIVGSQLVELYVLLAQRAAKSGAKGDPTNAI